MMGGNGSCHFRKFIGAVPDIEPVPICLQGKSNSDYQTVR